jgi:hypothetical protein
MICIRLDPYLSTVMMAIDRNLHRLALCYDGSTTVELLRALCSCIESGKL